MTEPKEKVVEFEGHIFQEENDIHSVVIPRSDVKKLKVEFDGGVSCESYQVTIKEYH